jgi:hypothetical protein
MSHPGQKQTWGYETALSAIPPKADIAGRRLDVRFVPKAEVAAIRPMELIVQCLAQKPEYSQVYFSLTGVVQSANSNKRRDAPS